MSEDESESEVNSPENVNRLDRVGSGLLLMLQARVSLLNASKEIRNAREFLQLESRTR